MSGLKIFVAIATFCMFACAVESLELGSSCIIERTSEGGICTKVKDCAPIYELFRQGKLRQAHNRPTVCSAPDKSVCCPQATSNQERATEEPENSRISGKKCQEYAKNVYKLVKQRSLIPGEPEEFKKVDKCMHEAAGLIIGGTEANDGEFPHMALLGYGDGEPDKYSCGGSLVSPNFVLTAAHCLEPRGYGRVNFVKVGMFRRDQTDSNVHTFNVKEIFAHPKYVPGTFNEDVGLIKLDGAVPLSERILPICLPQKPNSNEKAIATGFGKTSYQQEASKNLLKVTLERFTQEECQTSFRNQVTVTNDTMVCYGHHTEKKDSCKGDSGGPLQVYNEHHHCTYTQIGIVSYGLRKCGTIGAPGGYVNVHHYLDWIEDIVWRGEN